MTAIALAGLAACRSLPMVAGTTADSDAFEAVSLLGERLFSPPIPAPTREIYEQRLAEARRAHDRTPADADSIIWLGRRTAYLGRYREAISIFTGGIANRSTSRPAHCSPTSGTTSDSRTI